MKEDLLGLNHWLSFSARCHTVRPRSSALSSGHLRMAPPKSSSGRPRCFRYHAARAALLPLLLKKTPPTPVIFAIVTFLTFGFINSLADSEDMAVRVTKVHLTNIPRHVRRRPCDIEALLQATLMDVVNVIHPDRQPDTLVSRLVAIGAECHLHSAVTAPAL